MLRQHAFEPSTPRERRTGTDQLQPAFKNSRESRSAERLLIAIYFVLGVVSVASGHLAALVAPAAATLATTYLALRDRNKTVLVFTLWLWTTAPLVRRLVEYISGAPLENSPILLMPLASSLIAGATVLLRGRGYLPHTFLGFLLIVAYALLSGLLQNGLLAATTAFFTYLAPVALGIFCLNCKRTGLQLESAIQRFALFGGLTVALYAIGQWVLMPPWDEAWLRRVAEDAVSFGKPEPFAVRVFGSLNAPASLALFLVFTIVVVSQAKQSTVTRLALAASFVALALTQVRMAWICLAIAAIAFVLIGKIRLFRDVALGMIAIALFTVFVPVAVGVLGGRVSSLTAGAQDNSFQSRLELQSQIIPHAMSDLFGTGAGSAGNSSRLNQDAKDLVRHTDSTVVESLIVFGGICGTIAVLLVLLLIFQAIGSISRLNGVAQSATIYVVTTPIQLALTNVLTGSIGVFFWLSVALAERGKRPSELLTFPTTRNNYPQEQP